MSEHAATAATAARGVPRPGQPEQTERYERLQRNAHKREQKDGTVSRSSEVAFLITVAVANLLWAAGLLYGAAAIMPRIEGLF
jgi:hypothetical protein